MKLFVLQSYYTVVLYGDSFVTILAVFIRTMHCTQELK